MDVVSDWLKGFGDREWSNLGDLFVGGRAGSATRTRGEGVVGVAGASADGVAKATVGRGVVRVPVAVVVELGSESAGMAGRCWCFGVA